MARKTKKKRSRMSVSAEDAEIASHADEVALNLVELINAKDSGRATLWADDPNLSAVRGWVPTGFPWFDWMLSDGRGLPIGRVIQLWGEFAACKSSFAQRLITPYQRDANGICVYFDFEYALDAEWLRGYGVDQGNFIDTKPETLEEGFDTVFDALNESRKNPERPILMIWDSVAQALPVVERDEKSFASASVGVVPRAFSKACRKLPRRVSRCNSTMIFINQCRTNIRAPAFSDPMLRPGGQALDFASSAIIRMRKTQLKKEVKRQKKVWGYKISMKTDKNRLAGPHRRCEIIVDFENGPNEVLSLHHFLKSAGIIVAAGGKGQKLKGCPDRFKVDEWPDFMRENDDAVSAAVKKAFAAMSGK